MLRVMQNFERSLKTHFQVAIKVFDKHFSHGVIMKLHFSSLTKVLNGMYEANY